MNTSLLLRHSLAVAAMLAFPLAHAGTMTRADYHVAKSRISATYKADKAACTVLTANAKDICGEQAKGDESVARAELDHAFSETTQSETRLQVAKAKSIYAVAKEKCDDQTGSAKGVCVQEAKAAESRALTDAKIGRKVNAAITDAAKDITDAKYKLAMEKCESMIGEAKTICVAAAKSGAGKV